MRWLISGSGGSGRISPVEVGHQGAASLPSTSMMETCEPREAAFRSGIVRLMILGPLHQIHAAEFPKPAPCFRRSAEVHRIANCPEISVTQLELFPFGALPSADSRVAVRTRRQDHSQLIHQSGAAPRLLGDSVAAVQSSRLARSASAGPIYGSRFSAILRPSACSRRCRPTVGKAAG